MLRIGCHLSVSKGFLHMGQEAVSIGADTFQFFTRNPRGFAVKELNESDIAAYHAFAKQHGMGTVLAHAPYTLNACSKEEKTRELAYLMLGDDLRRMEYLPGNFYNFHPGCHVGQGVETGTRLISQTLNALLTEEQSTTVLLETMAGKGTEIGSNFEELRSIIDGVKLQEKMGVCMDTCHMYDAGYDLVNNLDGVLAQFDRVVGLDRLKAVHLNDSKNPFASHKDRHEKIGEGSIGLAAMVRIINHPALCHLPFYLETPNELPGYAREISTLRAAYERGI